MLVGTDWVHVSRVTTRSTSIVHHLRMIRCSIHLILLEEEGKGEGQNEEKRRERGNKKRGRDRKKRKGEKRAIKKENVKG